MRNVLAVAGLATAILTGACSTQPSSAVAPTAAAAPMSASTASASSGLDGVYRGPAGGTSGNSRCNRRLGSAIRVAGGDASMSTATTGTFEAPVGPDGSVSFQSGRAMLNGRFADNAFTGTYSNGGCSYTLNCTKS